MPDTQTCVTCKWWNAKGFKVPNGACWYNAPQIVVLPVPDPTTNEVELRGVGIRPTTKFDEYCHGYECAVIKEPKGD